MFFLNCLEIDAICDKKKGGRRMELYPEVLKYRTKHPRCRFCFYSNYPGLFEEKCSVKNSLTFPKFLQPLTCRFCKLYKVRDGITISYARNNGE